MTCKKLTMEQRLLKLLGRKWASPITALSEVGCMSLAQRVSQWRRAGVSIADKWVESGNGKRFKAYRLNGGGSSF
jgi:hypothetical protein